MGKRRTDYPFMSEITDQWQERIRNGECTAHTKVEFMCDKGHKNYFQTLNNHTKQGCPICADEQRIIKRTKKDYSFMNEITNEWQEKIKSGKYNCFTKVEFKCQNPHVKHPNYFQTLSDHQNQNSGCPLCSIEKRTRFRRKKNYSFINEISPYWQEKILNGECNCYTKVEFTCNKHGNYWQTLDAHQRGQGCPICKESIGEKSINAFLTKNGIDFTSQKIFDDCKYKQHLLFDFYIPNLNMAIEYQGALHYQAVDYFGGERAFLERLKRDNIKRLYCNQNKINLIEIPYWELNNIECILLNELSLN